MKSEEGSTQNHLSKTKSGLKWSFINQFSNQGLGFIVSIILARLIEPAEFGLVGMITVFTNFATIFINFGFSTVLIQKENVTKQDLDTVFVCNLVMGAFLYALFFLASPFIAEFFKEPRLELITRIVSLSFLIAPLNAGRSAMISKVLNFKLDTKITVTSFVVSAVVAIVLAANGFGVWSIITQSLVSACVSAVYFRIISDVRPSLSFSKQSFREMIPMSSSLVGDSLINYWTRNADNLLVGKFLGPAALGIYSRSYSLMLLPLSNITRVIMRVMLPSFSMIKHNKLEIKRIYLRICEVIAAITFPMMFGLSAVSEEFILALLGEKWLPMVPLVRLLSIVGALQSILALNGSIYVSQGKANVAFKVTLIFNLVFLSGFAIGMYFGGLYGVALAYFITSVIGAFPNFYFAARLIDVTILEMVKKLGRIFLSSLVMLAGIMLLKNSGLLPKLPALLDLFMYVGLGALIFLVMIVVLRVKIYLELKAKLMSRFN